MNNIFSSFKNVFKAKSASNIKIGIWGTTNSGKTTYATMLLHCLQKDDSWVAVPDKEYLSTVKDNTNRIIEQGIFPLSTVPNKKQIEIINYYLNPSRYSKFKTEKIVLSFIDAPGEFFENLGIENVEVVQKDNPSQPTYADIVDYLISCDGIIFLIDPKRSQEDRQSYRSLLIELLEECQRRYYKNLETEIDLLPQYFAFCITKIDEGDFWQEAENPIDWVKKIVGNEFFELLRNFCYFDLKQENNYRKNRCKFYGVSSIGRYLDEDGTYKEAIIYPSNSAQNSSKSSVLFTEEKSNCQSSNDEWASNTDDNSETNSTDIPKIKIGAKLKPINVTEPIKWLIEACQFNSNFS
jgi:GTPase SAR1 family protein